LLEFDDPRSGSFLPLKEMPDDKFVVLGLITTKKASLEKIEDLRERVRQASRHIGVDRLGISPQCGFASSIVGNAVSMEDQRRKLDLLVRAGREIFRWSLATSTSG
jgi:5-methyltetrahydropteroyltriglutamate--homocysteine methyltransferase